jgi:hypothetical protein
MVSQALAKQLKEAGLVWQTTVHDFFAIPDRDLDGRVFVLSDMMATMELLRGWPAVVFHGTPEWALDYLLTHEAVWLPTERQVREQLEAELTTHNGLFRQLQRQEAAYLCEIILAGQTMGFTAVSPSEAYGLALLALLQKPIL